ncbi:hypothetical protein [Serratia plymuthica]|uniref:Fimbrial adhesin MrpH C-terminal domain-containing protein n=1 Tax=Serratia plymuthica TaxID=82996 RepID=A0A2X4V5S9_SERPL|nr:hypothetical protein [Serratia plymuthica]QPS18645.1 hypothetical protein I6G64_13575 [Serratia plymuthica]QPS64918.1 hypothetical protein I6G52_09370 [Serratia plymuthica]RKS62626.1 hypothetical protein C8E17_1819 [Serratia plymuthica]CAI2500308.1 Uncharacterised protein [Serratia plymuthica]SQI46351.1 Uncharacterised protein [Serratia plymuthica]
MKLKSLIFLLLSFFCMPSQAIYQSYIWFGIHENGIVIYYGQLVYMSNPDDTPNPCYRMSRCEIGLSTLWFIGSTPSPNQRVHRWITPPTAQWVLTAPTMGDLGDNMGKNLGFPVDVNFGNMSSEGMTDYIMCITYRINGGAPQYMPGGFYCTGADGSGGSPPPARCEALTQDITFNYGALNASQVNGSVQKGQFSLRCDRNATVRIYAKGLGSGGLLTMNKSLSSRLRIANVAADKGYTTKVWANSQSSYEVSSTLEVSGDVPLGSFSGSTVIVMDIQ